MNGFGCTGHVPEKTGERYGHCGACHLDFMGVGAFEKHRRGPWEARYCVDPTSDDGATHTGRPLATWWQDERGRWHEGAQDDRWNKKERDHD